jgi:hypothetical protein
LSPIGISTADRELGETAHVRLVPEKAGTLNFTATIFAASTTKA